MNILLIGNDQYNHASIPDLVGCKNDVLLMTNLLKSLGHNIIQKVNVKRHEVIDELAKKQYDLLYWSGHGTQLRLRDGIHEALVCSYNEGMLIDNLLVDNDFINISPKFVILDTCFSGGMSKGGRSYVNIRPKTFRIDTTIKRKSKSTFVNKDKNIILLSASKANEVSYEVDTLFASYGLFTYSLNSIILEHSNLSLMSVSKRMMAISSYGNKQHPTCNGWDILFKQLIP